MAKPSCTDLFALHAGTTTTAAAALQTTDGQAVPEATANAALAELRSVLGSLGPAPRDLDAAASRVLAVADEASPGEARAWLEAQQKAQDQAAWAKMVVDAAPTQDAAAAKLRERRRMDFLRLAAGVAVTDRPATLPMPFDAHATRRAWLLPDARQHGLAPLPPARVGGTDLLTPILAYLLRQEPLPESIEDAIRAQAGVGSLPDTTVEVLTDSLDHGLRALSALARQHGADFATLVTKYVGTVGTLDVDRQSVTPGQTPQTLRETLVLRYRAAPPPGRLVEVFSLVQDGLTVLDAHVGDKLKPGPVANSAGSDFRLKMTLPAGAKGILFEGKEGHTFSLGVLQALSAQLDRRPAAVVEFRRKPEPPTPPLDLDNIAVFGELELSFTCTFEFRWNDHRSGASDDAGCFHPTRNGFKAVSSLTVQRKWDQLWGSHPRDFGLCVRPSRYADMVSPPLALPHRYTIIWDDKGSGASHDASVWRQLPPPGYVSCGDIFMLGHRSVPRLDTMCVRADLTVSGFPLHYIWNDRKSGADRDCAVFQVTPPPNHGAQWGGVALHDPTHCITGPIGANDADPDVGLIAPNGIFAHASHANGFWGNPQSAADRRRHREGSLRIRILRLPFPRREYTVDPEALRAGKSQLYREVWIPMSGVSTAADGRPPSQRVKHTPFYRVQLHVGTQQKGAHSIDASASFDRRYIRLPRSITHIQHEPHLALHRAAAGQALHFSGVVVDRVGAEKGSWFSLPGELAWRPAR